MKALGTRSPGSLSSLSLVDLPLPEPRTGEVRVRVHAAAVNPADVKITCWKGPARLLHAKVSPLVPGYDLSGMVDATGAGVTDLSVGDAVFGHLAYSGKTRQGSFAEFVTIDAQQVAKKPDKVDHATAAAAATVGLTALQALADKARVSTQGARMLILGASGGVGSLAVGVGKRLGAHVTGVCSGYAIDFVRDLGADAVVDRKTADPLAHAQPFELIYDTTGFYRYSACKAILTSKGAFVTTMPSPSLLLDKLGTIFSKRRCTFVMVKSRRADLERLAGWLAEGLSVPLAEHVPVRDAASALEGLSAGGLLGKIAIAVVDGF